MFSTHLTDFHGLPVFNLPPEGSSVTLPAAGTVAWRLAIDWDNSETMEELWLRFLATVDTARVGALVLGPWSEEMYEADLGVEVRRIVGSKDRLPALTGIFLCDVTSEENEVSWIEQTDLAPLLAAFPKLEELAARGGHRELTPSRHESLRVLRLESGGMSGAVSRAIGACELPALERLDLMLGSGEYGGDTTVEDLAVLLSGTRFPALLHLGLEDSEIQDAIAGAVAQAPVVPMLESLSLALGALTDDGAEALLSGQPLTHLKRLDLHHHFLSDQMASRLRGALEPAGVEVDLNDQQTPHDFNDGTIYRFIAVAE